MKNISVALTVAWEIYEKLNPLLDAWQVGSWVFNHLF
jgi:hypothetical protein